MQRFVVVAKLKPGAAADAQAILDEGPPFDPEAAGLARHGVYVNDTEVVFFFEGPDADDLADRFFADEAFNREIARWMPLLEHTPRRAHERFYWERPPG